MKLSIIIPYYDTYEYTIKLLRELQIQMTEEVEVIVIDDGCLESGLDIFENDFTIIHLEEHKGASYAWNVGIKQSQGDFIAFIDSDDSIMMNYVEELIKAIDADYADEIIFNWIDTTRNILARHPANRSIWKAIYRRNIVPFFDESYVCNTDVPFQSKLKATPHTKYYLDKTLYGYNSCRAGSITWRKHRGMLRNEK